MAFISLWYGWSVREAPCFWFLNGICSSNGTASGSSRSHIWLEVLTMCDVIPYSVVDIAILADCNLSNVLIPVIVGIPYTLSIYIADTVYPSSIPHLPHITTTWRAGMQQWIWWSNSLVRLLGSNCHTTDIIIVY